MTKKKNTPKEGRAVGRPSDYHPDYAEQARRLCLLGLTDKELAEFFGCCEKTLANWKNEHDEFLQAIRAGKIKADADVAMKLLDRALGAEWIEDQAFKVKHIEYAENGKKLRETEEIEVVAIRKAAPPDTPALSLWLRNRQPSRWRDKPEPTDDETAVPVKIEVQVVDARRPNDNA